MFRILLLVAVIMIGYDAIAHQGSYTRSAWASVVGLTDSAVTSAKQLGQETRSEIREENGTRP
jgi:hypothetical protein